MRIFRFVFFFSLTLTLTVLLHNPYGSIPPLGKLLSPKHGFWQNAELDPITVPESFDVAGLKEEVRVSFDEHLIPHIFAANDEDMFFAQGYITAFHRLWQMEFQLLATAGRISELFGDQALEFDRGQRRKGLTYGARRSLEALQQDKASYALVQAYTRGVNAYINQLSYTDLPIEYKLLDYQPEPWTEFKCVLMLKEMADQLSRGDEDLEYTNALKKWGPELFNTLYPEALPGLGDFIVPSGTKFDFDPIEIERPDVSFPLEMTKGTIQKPHPDNGSNSFIVNGKKTEDGSVLFANEPDLGLNLPSIWYLAHLNSPNYNVIGGTLPGTPAVIIGYNDSIAFGDTNAGWDFVDWYKITFKTHKREEYKYDDKWLKTQKIVEEIRIKDEESFFDTIVYTHYGPVVYDQNFKANSEKVNLAMRWVAHDPSNEFKTFRLLNQANNFSEFNEAYSYYTDPPQNVSVATAAGDIAIKISGKFAAKWQDQGKFLMDGGDSRFEWQGYIPEDQEFLSLNPPRNFVSSANQHPGDSTYPYYDFGSRFEHFRNRRINDRLSVMSNITEKDMMELQHDNFNYIAASILPEIVNTLKADSLQDLEEIDFLTQLEAWDFFNDPEVKVASFFELIWRNLQSLAWDEFQSEDMSLSAPNRSTLIYLLKTKPAFEFFDIKSTSEIETAQDLYRLSFRNAISELKAWQTENGEDYAWYKFKNTTIKHILPPLDAFSVSGVKIGGNRSIVNAASGRHGPSLRLVVKLNEQQGTQGWAVYPGSQTGNPGNTTYANMIDDWASGKYYKLSSSPDIAADAQEITKTVYLKPE